MIDDYINRQLAINAADRSDYTGLAVEDVKKVTDEVVKELKQLPSAMKWIPANKELPKTDKWRTTFNVTTDTGIVTSMDWENTIVRGKPVSRWIWQGKIAPWEVVAWMELPEPWKPEEY